MWQGGYASGVNGAILETTDELTVGANVDESPGAISGIHRIGEGLTHKTNAGLGLVKIFELCSGNDESSGKEADSSDVLLAAPNHFCFFSRWPSVTALGSGRDGGESQEGEENKTINMA